MSNEEILKEILKELLLYGYYDDVGEYTICLDKDKLKKLYNAKHIEME